MKKLLTNTLIGLAATLMLAAVPAHTAPLIIAFNIAGGNSANTYTSNGGQFEVAQLVYNASEINIPTADYLTVSFTISNTCSNLSAGCSGTLTVTNGATSDFAGVAANAQLYQSAADFSIKGTDTTGAGGMLNVTVADNTYQPFNATFFSDIETSLGLPANAQNAFVLSGGVTGQNIAGKNEILSDTVDFATPEPSSMLLFSAAALLGLAAKRKRILSLF